MLQDFAFRSVISLGVDCRVRFQISRFFEARDASEPALTRLRQGTHLFDWNIAWFSSVIACFENGFADLFRQENLRPLPSDADVAIDSRYDIRFYHLFHCTPGQDFAAMIASQYSENSKKVRYLRGKLLAHVRSDTPTLYVRCDGTQAEARRFCDVVRATYPAHRFHLVLVQTGDATEGFAGTSGDFSVYRMSRDVRKPPAAAWSGDDEEWNVLFREICREARVLPKLVSSTSTT